VFYTKLVVFFSADSIFATWYCRISTAPIHYRAQGGGKQVHCDASFGRQVQNRTVLVEDEVEKDIQEDAEIEEEI
jgi:hypothetical protein